MPRILITYFSSTGHTKKMAEAIAKGAALDGCDVVIKESGGMTTEDFLAADAIIVGSPTYYGTMAYEMKKLIDATVKIHGKLEGKVGGAFASSGMLGGGNETTVRSILDALLIHGMVVLGSSKIAHYGPVAIGSPDDQAVKECKMYGERIARLTLKLAR